MDDTPFSQLRSESPGYYVPAADASTQTTDEDFILLEPTRDASTQTTEDAFDLLAQIQSGRNISIVTSESTVDTSETVFSGFHAYRNDCHVVKTEAEDVSSSMGASTDFDMSSESKSHAGQDYVQKVSMAYVHSSMRNELKYRIIRDLIQAPERLWPEISGISSVLGSKEVSCRPLQIFYPGEPVGINVCGACCMTMTSSQQRAHSSHQLTQAECFMNLSNCDTNLFRV